MAIHTLQIRQRLQATRLQCWDFFADPRNLAKITPPDLSFVVKSELPPRIYAGLMIEYRVRPLLGIPLTWLTEIAHVREGESFVDEQRVGPYALWHHEHHFTDLGDGSTEMTDKVTYRLHFSPFSEFVHPWLVKPQLDKIFAYREKVVDELFGPTPQT
jgi:ligand-binding SRPBCC domain-containing protein